MPNGDEGDYLRLPRRVAVQPSRFNAKYSPGSTNGGKRSLMVTLIAAAVVTLFVNTADDKVSASDGVLSLREAIAKANASTQPYIITFKGKGLGYQFMKSALEIRTRAPLTINGDVNSDGLADVTL